MAFRPYDNIRLQRFVIYDVNSTCSRETLSRCARFMEKRLRTVRRGTSTNVTPNLRYGDRLGPLRREYDKHNSFITKKKRTAGTSEDGPQRASIDAICTVTETRSETDERDNGKVFEDETETTQRTVCAPLTTLIPYTALIQWPVSVTLFVYSSV